MKLKMTTMAGVFGNALEWFDFILYAYFAPIFSLIFFPTKDQFVSLILTFGVFASGFFVRPLGGFLIGYWGDCYGRKKALIFTIVLMNCSTIAIAFLPTYAQAGIIAPILLTIIRLSQGFAVSGELNSSTSFLIEHSGENHRGFYGSLAMCSGFSGVLLGSTVATIITTILPHKYLISWSSISN